MSNNQDLQIDDLNKVTKATIAPSKIHGVGVFAIRDIKKGEKLYCDLIPKLYHLPYGSLNKLFPEVKALVIARWPSIINGSKFVWPDARLVSFMNHADIPNYQPSLDIAIRDIKAGEEITESYRSMPNFEKIFPWIK